jgi:lysophospholipase L1-like esterase
MLEDCREAGFKMRRVACIGLVIGSLVGSPAITSAQPQWPSSVAALGDSITRATLADDTPRGLTFGQPEHSWALGFAPRDGILSHYERIRAKNPRVEGRAWNLAASRARAQDLPGQARSAVALGADHVIVQMGANDVCGPNSASMTPTQTFLGHYATALEILKRGLPGATVLVTATIRVPQVYAAGRNDARCQIKWATFRSCDNVLRNGESERRQADARILEYNRGLRALATRYGAAFDDRISRWRFTKDHLSEVDCFHPNRLGQQRLADLSYKASRF